MSDFEFKLATLRMMARTVGRCEQCGLCKTRKQVVVGQGVPNPVILFVGEAPGQCEDEQGVPFVGRAGQYLKKLFRETGGKGEWCYITNTVKCRPPNNRKPTRDEMAACRTWLDSQIAVLKPKLIVCVGQIAAEAILRVKNARMEELRGQWFDRDDHLYRLRCIYHPSYLLQYGREKTELTKQDLQEVWAEAARIMGGTNV